MGGLTLLMALLTRPITPEINQNGREILVASHCPYFLGFQVLPRAKFFKFNPVNFMNGGLSRPTRTSMETF
jgi:hypothetical protein